MNKENFFSKIKELSSKTKFIKIYPQNKLNVLKGMGNIIGDVDKPHIEFLELVNGMSVLDYCFWGFKNPKTYPRNIYEEMMNVWRECNFTTNNFWCIAGNSVGEYFGYISQKNKDGNHFIGYFNKNNPEVVVIISSSFDIFLEKFLYSALEAIENDNDTLDIEYSIFFDSNKKIINDNELKDYLKEKSDIINLPKLHKISKA